jgi:phospholipid/cholesterol/gamma-HCH transport system ATP-binding protein
VSAIAELAGVRKAFGAHVVYDDLTLAIERGETLTVLGASGSGKSVMLKMLIGLVRPDAGSIRVAGQEIAMLSEAALLPLRRRVSMLFQGAALFDSLTVGENVAYPLRVQGTLDEYAMAARVAEQLRLVGLPGIERMRPADLSGGMKKRVALARAIAGEPELVLFDEPTTGLDPINTRRILDLIRSIQRRLHITSVIVTHDLPSAYLISDRIAMLAGGRIIAARPTEEFRHSPEPAIHEFVAAMEPGAALASSQ